MRPPSEFTGVERKELLGSDFSGHFTQPDKAREGYRRVFAEGFVTDYPLTFRRVDGTLTDVIYNATLYRDAAGAGRGVVAAARDVTALRSAHGRAELVIEKRAHRPLRGESRRGAHSQ